MIKSAIMFMLVFAMFFLGIRAVTKLSGAEMLSTAKLVAYSSLCAFLSIGLLTVIVVLL
jgi:hypothetical protein